MSRGTGPGMFCIILFPGTTWVRLSCISMFGEVTMTVYELRAQCHRPYQIRRYLKWVLILCYDNIAMFHHLSLCTNLQNDVKSLISYRGIYITHNMLQFSCHQIVQHTARSLLSRAGQGVNALQFGGAGSADFTLHATIYVTLRSDEREQ